MSALVRAKALRVDLDGVPVCDGLDLETTQKKVLVLGGPKALFDATIGVIPFLSGELLVNDVRAAQATREGLIAGAAKDPPMPPRFTVKEYVEWSARLAGADLREVPKALERLALGPLAKTEIVKLVHHAKRATVVAAAVATGAKSIALEDPLGGLPDETAETYAKVLVEALGEEWMIFAPRMPLASPLAVAAEEAIVLGRSRVEAQGTPASIAAQTRLFRARMTGPLDALEGKVPFEVRRPASALERAEVSLDLTSTSTADLIAICAEAGIAVIELVPIARVLM